MAEEKQRVKYTQSIPKISRVKIEEGSNKICDTEQIKYCTGETYK